MAFFSGQASSYTELLNVLVSSCVAQGWTFADGILSKETLFVKPSVGTTETAALGSGLIIRGGTGQSGSSLINPSSIQLRIGKPYPKDAIFKNPKFPLNYKIFVFPDPNEVFLIVRYDIDRFLYLAFGKSRTNGMGLWMSSSISQGMTTLETTNDLASAIYINELGSISARFQPNSFSHDITGFFFQEYLYNKSEFSTEVIYSQTEGWIDSQKNSLNAVRTTSPLFARLPSAWSSQSPLLPVQVILSRPSSKNMVVAEIEHARYIRIDYYEPEQIITLGNDRWMVFPFFKKDMTVRNGYSGGDHSGTLGWAIRYDGP
ncbi:hypothetical protein [Acinetobacter guillouiae]|uniref:hypothetical protein n=1 Tax=Acinetobacter guillouiae TaxID=106649 RepID=UPI0028D118B2|nr:hypothetical protein [Acinetobacter guillouiae]